MRMFLPLILAGCLTAPALACINDSELITHEREFKSQYQESQYQPPEPKASRSTPPLYLGVAGVTMGLAGAVLLLRTRSKS